ncbi:MAG TPA: VWA domain-containing protein [Candidatus Acidoferrales bacterium]
MRLDSAAKKISFVRHQSSAPLVFTLAVLSLFLAPGSVRSQTQKTKLARPRVLDSGVSLERDPVTGELKTITSANSENASATKTESPSNAIRVETPLVPVTCSVTDAGGAALTGLSRENFRIFDNGVEQPITYFDAYTQLATIALIIDASPSVLPQSDEMKTAARALVDGLTPADQVAVVDFSAHTYLLLPFSNDWGLIRQAISRINVRQLFGDTGGSNIYQSIFLAAHELFAGRTGRKAIVLLTDGQDSGLGLTLDPVTASPRPGSPTNRLTFDDVARSLAAQDIQVFAVSTQSRPKGMTPAWLAAHSAETLLTGDARDLKIPAYTLYLAELVRRAGGQLYFLREADTLTDTFREIARRVRAEYTLGFAPPQNSATRPTWHSLRVEVVGHAGVNVVTRPGYYARSTP